MKSKKLFISFLVFSSFFTGCGSYEEYIPPAQELNPISNSKIHSANNKEQEFIVNTSVSGSEYYPAIAIDKKGNFVIAWKSNEGIFAQRYDEKGNQAGSEFKVSNESLINGSSQPSIAINKEKGDFVICWNAYEQSKANYRVYFQRYDEKGQALNNLVKVNNEVVDLSKTKTDLVYGDPLNPIQKHKYFHTVTDVSMNNKSQFVVAWSSFNRDGSVNHIFFQQYDSKGNSKGNESKLGNPDKINHHDPKVAIDENENFVVAWATYKRQDDLPGKYKMDTGIFAQRFNSKGIEQGNEIKVNSINEGIKEEPAISMNDAGNFIISWSVYKIFKHTDSLKEAYSLGIFGQKFKADGTPDGKQISVSEAQNQIQSFPSVALDDKGSFIVSWQKEDFQKDYHKSIFYRKFNANNSPAIKSTKGSNLEYKYRHNLAYSKNSFVMVWDGFEDTDDNSNIYAKRFALKTTK